MLFYWQQDSMKVDSLEIVWWLENGLTDQDLYTFMSLLS